MLLEDTSSRSRCLQTPGEEPTDLPQTPELQPPSVDKPDPKSQSTQPCGYA